jgi:hypothetical protein
MAALSEPMAAVTNRLKSMLFARDQMGEEHGSSPDLVA